jgi:hypothetical protein
MKLYVIPKLSLSSAQLRAKLPGISIWCFSLYRLITACWSRSGCTKPIICALARRFYFSKPTGTSLGPISALDITGSDLFWIRCEKRIRSKSELISSDSSARASPVYFARIRDRPWPDWESRNTEAPCLDSLFCWGNYGLVKAPRRDTQPASPSGMFGGKAPLHLAVQKCIPHPPLVPMRRTPNLISL